MRTVYLSPHLDDAVLSAGGLIYDQTTSGKAVEIWTFMCGFPTVDDGEGEELSDFAKEMHTIWGTGSAQETVGIRRQEDLRAAGLVGAKPVHFDFLDCLYRRGRNGEVLYAESVFVPLNDQEADLPAQIAQAMVAWLKPDDIVVCPLGIGGHVDHLLVRLAAEMAVRASPRLCPLLYDADIPYFLNAPDDLAPRTVGMEHTLEPVSQSGLKAWLAAIEAYASQQSSLFDSRDSMRERLHAYWSEAGGIRLWTAETGN